MIIFKELDITSFKSIFHCNIKLDELQSALYFLEGKNNTVDFANSNGAGKSTLFSALTYVLYGTIDDIYTKNSEYQNKQTKIPLKVSLSLSVQNVDYTIVRTLSTFKLYNLYNEDISELNKTDTEKKFLSILNLTKSEFMNFTYLSQSSTSSFLSKTPSEKLNCIKDFVFGQDLLSIQNKLDTYSKELKTISQNTITEISKLKGSISALKSVLEKQDKCTNYSEYSLEECKQKLETLKQQYDSVQKINQEQRNKELKLDNCNQELRSLKQQYAKIKQNICPTCGQKLLDNKVLLSLTEKAKQLSVTIQSLKESLSNLDKELNSLDDLSFLTKSIDKYKSIMYWLSNPVNINTEEIQKDVKTQTDTLNALSDKLNKVEFKQQQLNQLQKYFKTTFVQQIQQNFLSSIESYLNLYCYNIFNEDFKLSLNNNSLDLTVGGKSYSYFSGAERQRLDFIFVFAIKVALMNFTDKYTNLFIADESLSGQDSQAFENCLDLISDLTKSENLTTILVSHRDVEYQVNKIVIERNKNNTKLTIKD